MGKLIDRLSKMGRAGGPRIGFGGAGQSAEPRLAMLARLAVAERSIAQEAMEAGADGIIAPASGSKTPLREALGVPEAVLCGADGPGALAEDFVVIGTADTANGLFATAEADIVLRLPDAPPERLVRVLESLPVDAVALSLAQPVSVDALTPLYQVAQATRKPVLVQVPLTAGAPVLQAVRDAGASAIIVPVDRTSTKMLREMRSVLAALPPKRTRGPKARPAVALGLTARSPGENGE